MVATILERDILIISGSYNNASDENIVVMIHKGGTVVQCTNIPM